MGLAIDTQVELVIDDVWSRTEPKYRVRAIMLLIANMGLFGAMCCFMYWLRYGWYFPPTHELYGDNFRNTFDFAASAQITLHDLFMQPISLQLVPMQGVVIGLLIASLVSIPILVSILYGFRCSIPFCIMVGLLAVMPWLGATLLLSCVIAAYARIKLKFRFAAALLGLLPIGVYFFTASRGAVAAEDVLTPQIQRGLVIAPLLLSGLASCALTVVVLIVARIVDYRPGAIAPLLALMFLMPWFLFMNKVGRDELHYRLFEQHYGPESASYFANVDHDTIVETIARRLRHSGSSSDNPSTITYDRIRAFFASPHEPLISPPAANNATIQEALRALVLDQFEVLARQQNRVAIESDKFLRDFPESRYVPCVLYIKGRALDMRGDLSLLYRVGTLRFSDHFPNETSRSAWNALTQKESDSPLANVARFRLAQLDARQGKIDQAIAQLTALVGSATDAQLRESTRAGFQGLLAKKPAHARLQLDAKDLRIRATQTLSLLRHNREPEFDDQALIAYLNCDPQHPSYYQNLAHIRERFGERPISDNIELQLTVARHAGPERAEKLAELRRRYPESDVLPRLLYELGATLISLGRDTEAKLVFEELTQNFAGSNAASQARHLAFVGGGRPPGE